jgi:hypothetical protein
VGGHCRLAAITALIKEADGLDASLAVANAAIASLRAEIAKLEAKK